MENRDRNKILSEQKQSKIVIGVMIIMLFGKLAGLYRDMLIKQAYGIGTVTAEAFSLASQFPRTFLDVVFAAAFSAGFIPVLSTYYEKKDSQKAYKLANNFLSLILVASSAITILLIICSPFISSVFLANSTDPVFASEVAALSTPLLRIMLPTIVISGVAFSITGILQSLNEFKAPAAMSLVSNLLIVVYALLFIDKFGVYGLAAVFVLGWLTQILIQLPHLLKKDFKFKFHIDFKESGLKKIGKLMIPAMISSWALPINLAVNTAVASAGAGMAALETANSIYTVITGVFVSSLTNVLFTKFSQLQAADKQEEFGKTIVSSMKGMLFFLLPMSAGVFALAPFIIRIVFEKGAFTSDATQVTSIALRYFALGMVGFGLQNILSRGFYAAKEGRIPLISSLFAIAINAVLSFSLVGKLGIGGPAIASSISITIAGLILLFSLSARKQIKVTKSFALDILKMAFVTITMAILVFISYDLFYMLLNATPKSFGDVAAALISIIIGVLWYFGGALILKLDDAKNSISFVKSFIRRKKHE